MQIPQIHSKSHDIIFSRLLERDFGFDAPFAIDVEGELERQFRGE
jgi:hypothetical protein